MTGDVVALDVRLVIIIFSHHIPSSDGTAGCGAVVNGTAGCGAVDNSTAGCGAVHNGTAGCGAVHNGTAGCGAVHNMLLMIITA